MKNAVLGFLFAYAGTGQAAALSCSTPPSEDLAVSLSAEVTDAYISGGDISELSAVKVIAGSNEERHERLIPDASNKPRTLKNRARFNLDGVDASTESFDGIVHGFLFPIKLTAAELKSLDHGRATFHAVVISSTDSYHDGIMSYFPLACTLAVTQ